MVPKQQAVVRVTTIHTSPRLVDKAGMVRLFLRVCLLLFSVNRKIKTSPLNCSVTHICTWVQTSQVLILLRTSDKGQITEGLKTKGREPGNRK